MNSYLIFINKDNDIRAIADKFSFSALFFTGIWALYHKMFGLFFLYSIIQLLFNYLVELSNFSIALIPSVLLGFFAHDLLALKAQLEGYEFIGVVRALDEEMAKQRLIHD